MICWGRPVRLQTLFIYSWEVSSAVIVLQQGTIMVALLNQYTTPQRESKPKDIGRSVMKSMVTEDQIASGTGFGCRGTWVLGSSVKREINPKRAEGWKVLESTGKRWNHQNFILPVSSRFGVLKSHM